MIGELQKASLWKRVSAGLCDFILLMIVTVGLCTLLSAILGYDGYLDEMDEHRAAYEAEYGIDLNISADDFEALPEEEQAKYHEADEAMNQDEEVIYVYQMIFYMAILIVSIGLLLGVVVVELVFPLIFKNGQTLGKKVFGVAVMRTNAVKLTPPVLFVRAILGKFTIEIMVPVMLALMVAFGSLGFVGVLVIGLLLILEIVVFCATRTSSFIHDLLADTVVVDMASQRIYESEADLIEAKKKAHAEAVDKSPY